MQETTLTFDFDQHVCGELLSAHGIRPTLLDAFLDEAALVDAS